MKKIYFYELIIAFIISILINCIFAYNLVNTKETIPEDVNKDGIVNEKDYNQVMDYLINENGWIIYDEYKDTPIYNITVGE